MQRTALKQLLAWKTSVDRKPLIIRGARQVGKTWLMQEFARIAYKSCVYINFEDEPGLKSLFVDDFDINRIVLHLQVATSVQIQADETLIILDELQEAERGVTALKYFCEKAPQYHIVAAGSLLGIALHPGTSFPVGKVEFLDLHPLTYIEFLLAVGDSALADLLAQQRWDVLTTFKSKYIERLKQYYLTGGMPAVVADFVKNKDFERVRTIQHQILNTYEQDFSKHAPTDVVPRIRMVWNAIPAQLAKENRKFVYGLLKQGARAKEFELAIEWLRDCGLVRKVNRITKPDLPLKAYEDFSAFKLYLLDVGLLAAMSNLDSRTIIDGNRIFEEFKGTLTEQYVHQQLSADGRMNLWYWSSERSDAKLDFVGQLRNTILPVEVKAAENLQAKSLRSFVERYKPGMAFRISMSDFRQESWMTNIPLYAVSQLNAWTELHGTTC